MNGFFEYVFLGAVTIFGLFLVIFLANSLFCFTKGLASIVGLINTTDEDMRLKTAVEFWIMMFVITVLVIVLAGIGFLVDMVLSIV